MGIGQFFKKSDNNIKQAFSKHGVIASGLQKFGNDVVHSGPSILNTLGKIGTILAPIISTVAPEIGLPLLAGSQALQRGVSSVRKVEGIPKQMGL